MSGVLARRTQKIDLVIYDTMCQAIASAHRIDEVKEIHDKALAIEVYSRLAKNHDNERKASEIRLRAARRCGQLIAEMKTAQGARTDLTTSAHNVPKLAQLEEADIPRRAGQNWERMAQVPEEQFVEALANPDKTPTVSNIVALAPKPPKEKRLDNNLPGTDDRALWLWGRLQDWEREGLLKTDINTLLATMRPHMQKTTRELVPIVIAWLEELK